MAEQSRRAAEAREQEEQDRLQFRQDVRSGVEQVTTDEAADKVAAQLAARRAAREAGAQGRYAAQIAQGTADAAKIAKSSKDTTALLNNLGAYGTQAKTGADAASAAAFMTFTPARSHNTASRGFVTSGVEYSGCA